MTTEVSMGDVTVVERTSDLVTVRAADNSEVLVDLHDLRSALNKLPASPDRDETIHVVVDGLP